MGGVDGANGVMALVIVAAGGNAEEFTPRVFGHRAVGVHRTVDDDGGRAGAVGGEDLGDVGGVVGVGETFVVHDDVVGFGPLGVFVELDLALGGFAAFVDDGPGDGAVGFEALGKHFGLEVVVVAATAGDEQGAEGFRRGGGGGVSGECKRYAAGEEAQEDNEAGFHRVGFFRRNKKGRDSAGEAVDE